MSASDSESLQWDPWGLVEGSSLSPEDVECRNKLVTELGVTPWELSILESIWYGFGQVSTREFLQDRAHGCFIEKSPSRSAEAVNRCFREGWVQHLSLDFLDEKQTQLIDEGYIITTGLIGATGLIGEVETVLEEMEGLISFTEAGVTLYKKWIKYGLHPDHWTIGGQHKEIHTVYGTSLEQCELAISFERPEAIIDCSPAEQVGRWCDRWWMKFESGYRVRYRLSDEGFDL